MRLVLAGCSYLFVAGLAELLFWRHGSTTVTVTHVVTGGGTYVTQMVQPNSSIYQENPGPVTVILLLMLVAVCAARSAPVAYLGSAMSNWRRSKGPSRKEPPLTAFQPSSGRSRESRR